MRLVYQYYNPFWPYSVSRSPYILNTGPLSGSNFSFLSYSFEGASNGEQMRMCEIQDMGGRGQITRAHYFLFCHG